MRRRRATVIRLLLLLVLLAYTASESTPRRRSDASGDQQQQQRKPQKQRERRPPSKHRRLRFAGQDIHIGSLSTGDCPVEPPCYCSESVTTRGGAGPQLLQDRERVGRAGRAGGGGGIVVAQRITCGKFKSAGRHHRKLSKLRRFPRFVESNVAVERLVSLSYSGLTTIPGAAFHALKVVELDLQGNDFGDRISPKAFVGVGRRLVALNLAWSNITRLPGRVFRGLTAVRNISLAENRLRRLPSAVFDDLASLERLSLAGNAELGEIPADVFRHQGNSLKVLDLGYCGLHKLPWKLFRGLASLRSLDVRGNGLEHIDSFTFADLRSLSTLLLGHNPLRRLASRTLYGLTNLTVLRVDESSLEHVDHDVFRDVRHLETLDLGDNKLSFLAPGTLLIPSLRELTLDGNRLTEVPADISLLSALRYLDVSYNRITTVDRCLFESVPKKQASSSSPEAVSSSNPSRFPVPPPSTSFSSKAGKSSQTFVSLISSSSNPSPSEGVVLPVAAGTMESRLEYVNIRENPFHCDCSLFWLRSLRADVISRWSDRRSSVPFVPGKCWTPAALRGVAVTNWLDLDCIKANESTTAASSRCNRV